MTSNIKDPKTAFKKLGIFASREQLIVQALKSSGKAMTTFELAEYIGNVIGKPYGTGNLSSSVSSLRKDAVIKPIETSERNVNGSIIYKYILA
jgi:hypothetical protein